MRNTALRQKRAAKKFLESLGKGEDKSAGEILREAGYKESTSLTPQYVTESKGWQELMDKYLPDDLLSQVHSESLRADKVISARIVGRDANESTDDFIEVPDHPTRHKFLDTAYKLKGLYKPMVMEVRNFTGWTPEELDD